MHTHKIISFCLLSTLCFASTASFAAARKTASKPATGICVNERGDYGCYVYNYAEKDVVASYPKTEAADKSPEQRSATFPSKLAADTGGKYSLAAVKSANFKPFSVNYVNNGNGCMFTFSPPASADEKTTPEGYVISSTGIGTYTNDSCQHDGAALTIKEN